MNINDYDFISDTPFLALDLDVMDRNIHRIAQLAKEANVKLRPHTKTHKSTTVAEKQLEAGAIGITVAKLGEAEVMGEAGINNILIAFPIMGKKKLQRFSELLKRNELMVALDDIAVAKGINEIGEAHKKIIPIYVDVDCGLFRMGKSPEESVPSIIEIANLPFIEVRGLMSHTGHAGKEDSDEGIKRVAIEEATILHETKLACEKLGVNIQEISVGSTSTARFIKDLPYATEVRPGMYVYNDRGTMLNGGAKKEDCAVTVFATVVSHPSKDRIIIDAGSKTLAREPVEKEGFGYVKGHEELIIQAVNEEHGIVEVRGHTDLKVGDVIEIIPNHVCPVINLADELHGFRQGRFERILPVNARGKNR
ncbi:D-serine deaminase, pyridoxal phosphate-dependent [Virgibacillus subterraneus]|uniref:D-serine deaminase, pyridoxal phosphate-dependent n=1 Tax=Virgibacillus subterraneus TaxID=621109 RepID=A0A1H9G7E8_9BACI|nr:alanine racemase [Virgibacillus subterraneus]SEQ45943.1 D-serine deaminase, pyridoxal phosphate-dependent [Virgibacillus subterraneus]